jgi:hypothetical protein
MNSLKEEDLNYIADITYGIWFARNQHTFNQRNIEDSEVINKANTSIQDYIIATTSEQHHSSIPNTRNTNRQQHPNTTTQNKTWRKPDAGIIKINSDANLAQTGRWGLGVTCRDSDGVLIAAATWEMPGPDDPTLAEVYALYNAIHLALDCCFRDVLFESDSAKVISLINNAEENPRNYIGNMINGICSNRSSFRKCSFHHISREANRVAHILAGLTHEEPNKVWIEEDPPQLEIFSSHPP